MKYFIIALMVVLYFEILGQYLQSKFNKNICEIGLGLGLIVFLAYAYVTTSLLTALNCNFLIVIIIYSAFFITSIVFVIKDIRRTKYKFTWMHLLWIALMGVFIYYSLNQSLGDLHGFDSTFYLNMVTGNASIRDVNAQSVLTGVVSQSNIPSAYIFQSFYYFASYVVYFATKLFGLYPGTTYIWVFQVLFYSFFFSLLINAYRKLAKNKYALLVLSILLLGFYFCKLYFNSVFGFIGNSYRIVCVGYICMFLKEYFDSKNIESKALVTIASLSACSVSSSSTFIVIILFYSLFFITNNDDRYLKWAAISIFLPLINVLAIISKSIKYSILFSLVLTAILYLLSELIAKLSRKYKLNIWILLLSIVFMVFMSYRVTGNILDISTFTNSMSESADMTINYFSLVGAQTIKIIYCVVFFTSFIVAFIFNRNNRLLALSIVVFIIFLNPFCCPFFYSIDIVYHRTWDLIINPFMYIYAIYLLCNTINNKRIETLILASVSLISIININFLEPSYYHDTFEIDENYDKLHKMSKNQYDVIVHLKDDISGNGSKSPKIVTQNILTQSMIPEGIYTYGRGLHPSGPNPSAEYQIYAIFYQEQGYKGFYQPKDADVENVEKYIKEAGIDYLVLEKDWCYLDPKTNTQKPLMYKIDEFKFPFYENDEYVIYHFDK